MADIDLVDPSTGHVGSRLRGTVAGAADVNIVAGTLGDITGPVDVSVPIINGTTAEIAALVASYNATHAGTLLRNTDTGAEYEWNGIALVNSQIWDSGAARVKTGIGGAAGVTEMEVFVVGGGASQTGTYISLPRGFCSFQAVANGTSGAFTATITIMVSNNTTNFLTAGRITLSGTATTAALDGFVLNAPWAYVRADVSNLTGTGANCTVYMGI